MILDRDELTGCHVFNHGNRFASLGDTSSVHSRSVEREMIDVAYATFPRPVSNRH
jgi:hypothetical protein